MILVSIVADGGELNPLAGVHDAAIATLIEQRQAYAQRYLDSVRARLEADGVSASTVVATGHVAESILATATAQHSGLIAMATHGRVGPERWFLGSVADKVVRMAAAPVLLIRPREDHAAVAASVKEILLPLDGSPLAEVALPYATFLARVFAAPITVIRTVPMMWWATGSDPYGYGSPPPDLLTALEDDARQYLVQTAEKLRASGVEARSSFALFRPPDQQITDLASQTTGALVVMSTHGRSGLGRTLLGSVTDRVIRSSTAPVLVVR